MTTDSDTPTVNELTPAERKRFLAVIVIGVLVALYALYILPPELRERTFFQAFYIGIPCFVVSVFVDRIPRIGSWLSALFFGGFVFYGVFFLGSAFIIYPLNAMGVEFAENDKHVILFNGSTEARTIHFDGRTYELTPREVRHLERGRAATQATGPRSGKIVDLTLRSGINVIAYGTDTLFLTEYKPLTARELEAKRLVGQAVDNMYPDVARKRPPRVYTNEELLFQVANGMKYYRSEEEMDLRVFDLFTPLPNEVLVNSYLDRRTLRVVKLTYRSAR